MTNFYRNSNQNTRGLAESGVLLALMMLLVFAGLYIPVLGGLAVLLQPGILFLLMARQGVRWAGMVVAGATILAFAISGPIQSLGLLLTSLFPGFVFSYLLYRRLPAGWTLLGTTISFLIGFIVALWISIQFLGMVLSPDQLSAQVLAVVNSSAVYQSMPADQLENVKAMIPLMAERIYGILGAGFTLASLASAFLNYKITEYLARRFSKIVIPSFPPFVYWRFPVWTGMPFIITIICIIYIQYQGLLIPGWMEDVGTIAYMTSGSLMLLQGMAVFRFMLLRYQMPNIVFYLLVASLFIVSFIAMMAIFTGVADLFLNYRRINTKENR